MIEFSRCRQSGGVARTSKLSRALGTVPPLNMSVPLNPDIWRLIFIYLEHTDIHKLRCIGDRSVAGLVVRRESSFYVERHHRGQAHNIWPCSLSQASDLRILEVVHLCQCFSFSPALTPPPSPAMSHKLVYLKVHSCNFGVSPFVIANASLAKARIAELDVMLPHLRYLNCYDNHRQGLYVAPSSVTHFVILVTGACPLDPLVPLPPHLISLECTVDSMLFLEHLPISIESIRLKFALYDRAFPKASHLLRLVNLKEMELYSFNYVGRLTIEDLPDLLALPPKLTNLRLLEFELDEALLMSDWLPKSLVSLYIEVPFPASAYSLLPRTLQHLTSRNSKAQLVHEHRWDISGGNVRRSKVVQPLPHDIEGRLENGLLEAGLEPLPPALQHLRLGAFAPAHIPNWMEQLSTHFVPGLTSLDMRCTSSIESSQFVHLPVTLTLLNFEGVTLPKVKHLHRLHQLVSLGLYGGILTTSIAKALPRAITALTLAQVALITKGHYCVSAHTEYLTYSETSPQISPLGHLPAHLRSLKLLPSAEDTYWETKLTAILEIIPSQTLETLIIDIKRSADSDFCQECDVLLRFNKLKHFFWNTPSYTPNYKPSNWNMQTSAKLLTVLPPSLTALCVPNCIWASPRWSKNNQDPTLSPNQAPPLLRYIGGDDWENSTLVHYGIPFHRFEEYSVFSERHSILTTCRSSRTISYRYTGGSEDGKTPDPLGHLYRPAAKAFL